MSKISDTDALILCGGKGTRLKGVEDQVPKVMVDFNGRPFLDILIDYLRFEGIERVILCTGYRAPVIENYYRKKNLDIVVDFSREEEALGTGGALYNAKEIIGSDNFVVLNGDSFCPVNLENLIKQHETKGALVTIAGFQMGHADDYGSVIIDELLNIVSFEEKKQGAQDIIVNAGVYCFRRSIFDECQKEGRFSLEEELFPELTNGGLYAFMTEEPFWDIGTPERLEKAREHLKGSNL